MISYTPLWETMKRKDISAYALTEKHNIGNFTLTRMRNGLHVSTRTLEDLCKILNCDICDIVRYIPDDD